MKNNRLNLDNKTISCFVNLFISRSQKRNHQSHIATIIIMIVSLHAPRKEDTYAADAAAAKKSFKAGKSLSTTCYNCQLVV